MPATSPNAELSPEDTSPLYQQLARQLTEGILAGTYRVDQALPSERVLSESRNLSRVTARKAIDRLVEQGLIVRKHGSGNYIAPRLEQPLTRLTSFSEELHQRGFVLLPLAEIAPQLIIPGAGTLAALVAHLPEQGVEILA